MKSLRQIIKEELLLEKRIAQIVSSISVSFMFEIDKSTHANDNTVRPDIEDYNQTPIANAEIRETLRQVIKVIAEKIVTQEIKQGEEFVVKSLKWELALAISPVHISGTYWKLILRTIFRESESNPFRVGRTQLVIYTDD
jgi:hypothetical protein